MSPPLPAALFTTMPQRQVVPSQQIAGAPGRSASREGPSSSRKIASPQASPRTCDASTGGQPLAASVNRVQAVATNASHAFPLSATSQAQRLTPSASITGTPVAASRTLQAGSRLSAASTVQNPSSQHATFTQQPQYVQQQQQQQMPTPHPTPKQVTRQNLSPPQTPVQQTPYRGIQPTGARTGSAVPGIRHSAAMVGGVACGAAATSTTTTAASLAAPRVNRMSRRESPPNRSPARRPRSSGPPQPATVPIQSWNPNANATAIAQGATVTMGHTVGPSAPPTPAQQPRLTRPAAAGSYPVPNSPMPCNLGRSLSPVALPPQAQMGQVQHRPAGASSTLPASYGQRPGAVAVVRSPATGREWTN